MSRHGGIANEKREAPDFRLVSVTNITKKEKYIMRGKPMQYEQEQRKKSIEFFFFLQCIF